MSDNSLKFEISMSLSGFSVVITRKQSATFIEVYEGLYTSDKQSLLIAINFKAVSLSLFSSNAMVTDGSTENVLSTFYLLPDMYIRPWKS